MRLDHPGPSNRRSATAVTTSPAPAHGGEPEIGPVALE